MKVCCSYRDIYEAWNFNKRTSIFGCNIQCLTNNCESWIHQLPKWEITNHPFWSTSLVWLSCYSWSPFWWLELAFKKGTRVGLMLESKSFNEFWSGTWVVCGGRQWLGVWMTLELISEIFITWKYIKIIIFYMSVKCFSRY